MKNKQVEKSLAAIEKAAVGQLIQVAKKVRRARTLQKAVRFLVIIQPWIIACEKIRSYAFYAKECLNTDADGISYLGVMCHLTQTVFDCIPPGAEFSASIHFLATVKTQLADIQKIESPNRLQLGL